VPYSINFSDFRPIRLIYAIAKYIAKMLASRFASHMDSLVSNSQSAFIKTEQRFRRNGRWKCNFRFRLIWNLRFRVDVHGPISHAHHMTSSQTFKAALLKIDDHVISSYIRGRFQGLTIPSFIVNRGLR
jgi:hypothetical protein